MTFCFAILIVLVTKASCSNHTLTYQTSNLFQVCRWRHPTACCNLSQSLSIIGGVADLLTTNCLGEIVLRRSQLPTQHFRLGCRLLWQLGKRFVWRNFFKRLFSHILPQFLFNGIFQQSDLVQKYFFPTVISSSLSLICEQIFRLLLKISVCEEH